jgi:hypothetical protein
MRVLFALVLALGGCQLAPDQVSSSSDDGAPVFIEQSCLTAPPLVWGHCEGSACAFAPLADGEHMIWSRGGTGPELTLLLRATGLDPSTDPQVDLSLTTDTGRLAGEFHGRVRFSGDLTQADSAPVTFAVDPRVGGDMLRATASVEDHLHERRCGRQHLQPSY